jgi:hypothetical protein
MLMLRTASLIVAAEWRQTVLELHQPHYKGGQIKSGCLAPLSTVSSKPMYHYQRPQPTDCS